MKKAARNAAFDVFCASETCNIFLAVLCNGGGCSARRADGAPLPTAPTAQQKAADETTGAYSWFGKAGLTCGAGVSRDSIATKPTVLCGAIFGIMPLVDLELGAMGPLASRSSASGYFSAGLWIPLASLEKHHDLPLADVGYVSMFQQPGHAMYYGVGYAHALDASHSVEVQARDYVVFNESTQHNVVLRLAWLVGLPD